MPTVSKTKSGERYRAPTDQARKQERKKENKRNKRDRQQIRQAMAKFCNLDETTSKLLLLERQVLGLDPQPFHIDVLKKKQKVLTELLNKRRMTLQQSKNEEELKRFNDKINIYNADCRKLAILAEQARMAREADPDSIPLPMGDMNTNHFAPPALKKKVEFQLPVKSKIASKAPGPPCGIAPDFSDSEEEDQVEQFDDNDLGPVPIPDFDHHPAYPPQPIFRHPGPSYNSMPPRLPYQTNQYNPMGFAHHHHHQSHLQEDAVISSAPQINVDSSGPVSSGNSVLSAAPELRNLRKETVKLVPAQLVRRTETKTMMRPVPTQKRPEAQQQAKSTDEAYNDFMKELDGLI